MSYHAVHEMAEDRTHFSLKVLIHGTVGGKPRTISSHKIMDFVYNVELS